ncbi:MAG: DinB family protein [Bryobacterales bacterium]|nr:DinB family protein [Bryobacterales bacterium]
MLAIFPGRPQPDEHPPYAVKYLARVPEEDILAALAASLEDTDSFILAADPVRAQSWRYEPGKWTLCDVIGHICDTERVLAYRALRIARGDTTPLPSFDHDAYVTQAPYSAFTPAELAAELRTVRAATLSLFSVLTPEAWTRVGTAGGHPISVRALAWFICGHERHHLAILQERYAAVAASA